MDLADGSEERDEARAHFREALRGVRSLLRHIANMKGKTGMVMVDLR